ncbi:MAG: cytochrome B5 [Nitrospirae bacterium]|nr:cytochrome B5 [Nitrospirota bacterium]
MTTIRNPRKNIPLIFTLAAAFTLFASLSYSIPEYAEKTKQGCKICHLEEEGGDLSNKGLEYSASGYVWPPSGGFRVLGPIKKSVRFFIGALHIVAAFLWFGTILYVHLILRPGYAARGLPKGEVALGMVSMAVVGVTGLLLTISKIRGLNVLYESQWGLLLSTKIGFYILMVSTAIFVVFFVGPKLKKGIINAAFPKSGVFDPLTLSGFDGKEGRPSYIAYKGNVYDVTGLKLWKNGVHMKHLSGNDLTGALSKAPHGEDKLEALGKIGSLDASLAPPKSFAQKAFYFIAYMNLAIVFCVLFVIAYWRWGI